MKERSLVILKPDVVARGVAGEIIARFERVGLKIVAMKLLNAPSELARKHYEKDDEWLLKVGKRMIENQKLDAKKEDPKTHGSKVVEQLAQDLTIFPVVAMILEGHDTIALVRKMLGETSPEHSAPGTIRGDYSQDTYYLSNKLKRPVINLVHASDSVDNAEKEISLWFKKEEIVEWEKPHEALYFRKGNEYKE